MGKIGINKLGNVQREDVAVYEAIMAEKKRQQSNIELLHLKTL